MRVKLLNIKYLPIYFLIFIFCFTLSAIFAQQEEEVTITTYTPSPYGSYEEMRAKRMAIGPTYQNQSISDGWLIVEGNVSIGANSTPALLYIDAKGNPGTLLSLVGRDNATAGGLTILNISDENNGVDFIIRAAGVGANQTRVGIGTGAPNATLDVRGTTNLCVASNATPISCPAFYMLTTPENATNSSYYMCCRYCNDSDGNGICN